MALVDCQVAPLTWPKVGALEGQTTLNPPGNSRPKRAVSGGVHMVHFDLQVGFEKRLGK